MQLNYTKHLQIEVGLGVKLTKSININFIANRKNPFVITLDFAVEKHAVKALLMDQASKDKLTESISQKVPQKIIINRLNNAQFASIQNSRQSNGSDGNHPRKDPSH
jgi:hypothetical protein